jgi:AraC-like DNA-binding protein
LRARHRAVLDARVPAFERHLLRARDLADARYDAPLDVPAMARRAHVSTAHFSRCFKETFGETPHQYLLTRRIQRAQELLRLTDLPVRDICEAVGYTSLGSFSATFKRVVGLSPTAWRAAAREEEAVARLPSCITRRWLRPVAADRAEMEKRAR